ncbi:MAG: hypothetical protein MZU95_05810 [Desulfomicrobium escambiense]|nr:hypothetical protein [Desulfomicrobium escambiense]
MAVPFLDLKAIYNEIRSEVTPEINDVLESCGYVLGPKVAAFEEKFARIAGSRLLHSRVQRHRGAALHAERVGP